MFDKRNRLTYTGNMITHELLTSPPLLEYKLQFPVADYITDLNPPEANKAAVKGGFLLYDLNDLRTVTQPKLAEKMHEAMMVNRIALYGGILRNGREYAVTGIIPAEKQRLKQVAVEVKKVMDLRDEWARRNAIIDRWCQEKHVDRKRIELIRKIQRILEGDGDPTKIRVSDQKIVLKPVDQAGIVLKTIVKRVDNPFILTKEERDYLNLPDENSDPLVEFRNMAKAWLTQRNRIGDVDRQHNLDAELKVYDSIQQHEKFDLRNGKLLAEFAQMADGDPPIDPSDPNREPGLNDIYDLYEKARKARETQTRVPFLEEVAGLPIQNRILKDVENKFDMKNIPSVDNLGKELKGRAHNIINPHSMKFQNAPGLNSIDQWGEKYRALAKIKQEHGSSSFLTDHMGYITQIANVLAGIGDVPAIITKNLTAGNYNRQSFPTA